MAITRHNYEEYFLLYADDELSAAERREVEDFLELHPDLVGELDVFFKLKLDDRNSPVFDGKASLYRPLTDEHEPVSENEMMLLSYMDGELNGEENKRMALLIAHDPEIAARHQEYLAAVLPSSAMIPFPDKSSLYRKESKPAILLKLNWTRVAVAAALVLFGGSLWLRERNQIPTTNKQVAIANDRTPAIVIRKPETSNHRTEANKPSLKISNPVQAISNTLRAIHDRPSATSNERSQSNNELSTIAEKQPVVSNNLPTPPASIEEGISSPASPKMTSAIAVENTQQENADAADLEKRTKTDYATEVLLSGRNTATGSIEEMEKSRKGPFRALSRKASRFFNKATNPDPDRNLVKVASFEIPIGQ
jgi:hypothetical protein